MSLALQLARRGLGRTSPNPAVGAVIVKDGKIVGKGYHRAAGEPHAEVEAIRAAGSEARGAELFVTLEPCNHHGRTPPCVEAILDAGISKVWYGMDDPNPGVTGGGAKRLREAGVEAVGHVFEDRCRRLNEIYLLNITQRRPFVFLKLAMSLDGRIATRTGHSQWITSDASRRKVHRLRDRVSAIMVGVETVIADNPLLTTRLPGGRGRDPIRIIADSNLRTPVESSIFNQSSTAGVIIASRKDPPLDKKYKLESRGAKILRTSGVDRVDLRDMLNRLYQIGITSLLIEGGAGLAWGAFEAGVVDRCLFFYAPIIIGGSNAPSGVEGIGISKLDEAPRLAEVKAFRVGPDLLLDGKVSYPTPGLRLSQK
ncbi:MAG: bifunctional diaminohydroxyphosphoribosylaminopyrimidine deaminase/5-amino-6-(5-phosphoribosylamino)uracil reductase RibD [Desulfomonile tiedjei]|uniref:Riboflavin biosynthesis protein RibD n=1 Tax=Desulfomonile tiedjei TaxID=2358 RepID=A0A9D6V463_9BACT|nr:bifunctional diaminohydroxyphosphoribosylaminopyrimidine deaminase/5-amino-6-(5-phosphoribosylamino)uracil reductase RibD [Desulfomonile tiedjei]